MNFEIVLEEIDNIEYPDNILKYKVSILDISLDEGGDFMKTRKQIFRNFQYLECDAFAEYLEEWQQKGWRFCRVKLGMIFEKEEPRKERCMRWKCFLKEEREDVRPSRGLGICRIL